MFFCSCPFTTTVCATPSNGVFVVPCSFLWNNDLLNLPLCRLYLHLIQVNQTVCPPFVQPNAHSFKTNAPQICPCVCFKVPSSVFLHVSLQNKIFPPVDYFLSQSSLCSVVLIFMFCEHLRNKTPNVLSASCVWW